MIYLKNIDKDITIGTGQARKDTNIGKKKVMIKLEYEKKKDIILNNMKYITDLTPYNLYIYCICVKQ